MSESVHGRPLPKRPKDLAKDAQFLARQLIEEEGCVKHYEVLSLDILGNGLATLSSMGAMHKDKRWVFSTIFFSK
jgi:glycerone phosphate O-acyltransferase